MALGKKNNETKAADEHLTLKWFKGDEIKKVVIKPGITKYVIALECSLTLYDEYESCNVNIWGFSIWCKVRETKDKSKLFLAFPSYKKSDGSYGDFVTCFDKEFLQTANEILTKHFE